MLQMIFITCALFTITVAVAAYHAGRRSGRIRGFSEGFNAGYNYATHGELSNDAAVAAMLSEPNEVR